MIENTIDLLSSFAILMSSFVAIGYISNHMGLKLYESCKNTVNCDADANRKAEKTGYISIFFIVLCIISAQIYLNFNLWLIVAITSISIAFIISGFITNTNFEN